jgi:hypothetical protein
VAQIIVVAIFAAFKGLFNPPFVQDAVLVWFNLLAFTV